MAEHAIAAEREAWVAPPVIDLEHRNRVRESLVTDPRIILIARRANSRRKRALDIVVSLGVLIGLAPALLFVAFLVWLQDRGAPLYGHERVGRHGKRFVCWKFRSMSVHSKELLAQHLAENPEAAAEWEATHKLTDDPRVTFLGKILRKSSVDEFPQFWNVLKGEMTLVGPRPITRPELDRYGKDRRYYLLVRPGLTGLWQVSGRSNTTYEERVKLDRDYFENYSFKNDLLILLRTVPAVLFGRGAG